MSEVGVQPNTH